MKHSKHEILEQKMCKELDILEEKFSNGAEMSIQDLEKIDKLYHALKSKATYDAMKESEEYEDGWNENGGISGYHGPINNARPYSDGYSRGYSEAMTQMGNSGYYPMMPRRR